MKLMASLILVACLGLPPVVHAWQPMSDSDLEEATGQQGVAIGLEYGVNTDPSGAPLSSLGGCTVTGTGDKCRFAWQLAARTDTWTVFKDSYMSLRIPAINLDVQSSMGAVGSNPTYFDIARFQDASGACLLAGGVCDAAHVDSLPALKLHYPDSSGASYNPATGQSSGYSSLGLGLVVGRMALEFGATGYLNDNHPNSFLGAKIADNNGNFANWAIGGNALLYGF